MIVESASGVIGDALEKAARGRRAELGSTPVPVFTYLANTIRMRDREVPYSLVSGIDLRALPDFARPGAGPGA